MSYEKRDFKEAISHFISRLVETCDGDIVKIVLFGSYAKGLADESSDVDVLVVHGGDESKIITRVAEVAFDTMLKYHIPIQPLTINIFEYNADNPFIAEVKRTGEVLFSANPIDERNMRIRDYYALALEWLKYARDSHRRGEVRPLIDSGYNAAELAVKALITAKSEDLAGPMVA